MGTLEKSAQGDLQRERKDCIVIMECSPVKNLTKDIEFSVYLTFENTSLANSAPGLKIVNRNSNSLAEFQGDMLPTSTSKTMWAYLSSSVGTDLPSLTMQETQVLY